MDLSTVFWTLLSLFYVGFSYFAALALIGGLVWRLVGYFRAPMPIPVASTPAPETEGGTLVRLLGDLLIFPNLFKADKLLWAGAWIFHAALATILVRHLRYFTYPVPDFIQYLEPVALLFGYLFGLAILFLFWRRLALPRTLYISNIPDYFALVLLGLIAGTGILVSYWAHVYIRGCEGLYSWLDDSAPHRPTPAPAFLAAPDICSDLDDVFPLQQAAACRGHLLQPDAQLSLTRFRKLASVM